jgi:hypothetical protein
MGMAKKLAGKDRRALLQGMRNLQAEGLVKSATPQKQVLDRNSANEQRKHAGRTNQMRWLYMPSDLVSVKDWRYGVFNATIITVDSQYATVLGPMGAVMVPCSSIKLIDRYEEE